MGLKIQSHKSSVNHSEATDNLGAASARQDAWTEHDGPNPERQAFSSKQALTSMAVKGRVLYSARVEACEPRTPTLGPTRLEQHQSSRSTGNRVPWPRLLDKYPDLANDISTGGRWLGIKPKGRECGSGEARASSFGKELIAVGSRLRLSWMRHNVTAQGI